MIFIIIFLDLYTIVHEMSLLVLFTDFRLQVIFLHVHFYLLFWYIPDLAFQLIRSGSKNTKNIHAVNNFMMYGICESSSCC